MILIKTCLPLAATALLLAACNTPTREATQATPPPTQPAPEAKPNLRKGMTESEIRTVWGEPKAVHAGKEAGETILVYHFDVLTTQQMVAAAMTEVPAVDPITGEARTVMEPTLMPQNVTVTQTIVLQLKEGKLASWARQFGEQRAFK